MSISEAILFVATNSNASRPCLQFVSQQKIPMQVVRLDTESARKSAASGKFFQITVVPTMVIAYEDGNTQLFLGSQKIIQWLTAMMKASSRPEPQPSVSDHGQNMYGPISTSYPIAKSRRPIVDEGDDIEDEDSGMLRHPRPPQRKMPVVVEDDEQYEYGEGSPYMNEVPEDYQEEPQDEVVLQKPKARAKKGKGRSKKVVEEEDPSSAAGKRRLAKEKLNKAAAAKSKPLSSKMKNVYDSAKQMEEDMKNSLGYKEEELPHY